MSTKQIKEDTIATLRGVRKVYQVSVGVLETAAWIGLLAIGWTITMSHLKGNLSLDDWQFIAVTFSTAVITLRLAYEGAKYFREIGKEN